MSPNARMRKEPVPIRVHDIIIRGNFWTKDAVIKSEVEELLRGATTFQELRHAAAVAEERLRALDIFESVNVRVYAGPELPGTATVVVKVSEPSNPFVGKLRSFAGDIWDASMGVLGVSLPRFEASDSTWSAGINLLSQDWLRFSSHKELELGLSLGLLSSGNFKAAYNLSWCSLPVPPQLSYNSLSAMKYSIEIDQRDSLLRPTRGFGFFSSTLIGGQLQNSPLWPSLIGGLFLDSPLWPTRGFGFLLPTLIGDLLPDSQCLRFIHQEVKLCHAFPLGFCGAALNLGVSASVFFRFFVHGFRAFGLGPAEPIGVGDNMNNDRNFGVAYDGGDLSLGAFADLSFDLPSKVLRDVGIFGHAIAITNCSSELTGNAYREFSLQNLRNSFRHYATVGVVIPTSLFDLEVNYCHAFGSVHDQGKTDGGKGDATTTGIYLCNFCYGNGIGEIEGLNNQEVTLHFCLPESDPLLALKKFIQPGLSVSFPTSSSSIIQKPEFCTTNRFFRCEMSVNTTGFVSSADVEYSSSTIQLKLVMVLN